MVAESSHGLDVDTPKRIIEIFSGTIENAGERPHGVPLEWVHGVEILKIRPRPSGVPVYRWRVFVDDCERFITNPWARRAAELGWDAGGLFGSRYPVPQEHIGSSGLLWSLAGGRILQIHRDGADILGQDGRVHRFHRRPDRAMTFLPWRHHE
jgi:hypothetical protein